MLSGHVLASLPKVKIRHGFTCDGDGDGPTYVVVGMAGNLGNILVESPFELAIIGLAHNVSSRAAQLALCCEARRVRD